jgi:alpha-beta hydrolase superfamily lysophospholipase
VDIMKLIVILAAAYGSIVIFLYFAQASLLFPGMRLPNARLDQPRTPERLELSTGDGNVLRGMLFPATAAGTDLVIGFGGNAQNAEMLGQDLATRLPDAHVVVFHYRGYGPSTGQPGEAALLADALRIHDALVERLRPARTFAVGISLGSAMAAWLSKQRALAGVLLVTPFDSIEAVAKESYFWIPVGLLLRHRFPSVEYMRGNATPTAVIAAENDHVVPPRRTAALAAAVPNLVFNKTLAGARHATIYELPAYDEAFLAAFAALREAAPKPSPDA